MLFWLRNVRHFVMGTNEITLGAKSVQDDSTFAEDTLFSFDEAAVTEPCSVTR